MIDTDTNHRQFGLLAMIDKTLIADHLRLLTGADYSVDLTQARTGGMSHINAVATCDDEPTLLVRIPPTEGPLEPYAPVKEARAMAWARKGGIPVPEVLFVVDAEIIGRPFLVMEFVHGQVLRPPYGAIRPEGPEIGRSLVTTLAALHNLPVDEEAGSEMPAGSYGHSMLSRWWPVLVEERSHLVVFDGELVGAWLDANAIDDVCNASLVHGDYRLGNLMWRGTEVAAVLDWETAALGDPLFDLAWLLMGTEQPHEFVMGVLPRHEAIALYESERGIDIDHERLLWWEVTATWVRLCMEIRGLRLARRSRPTDLRFLLWEFGHRPGMAAALRRIRRTIDS